MKRVLLLCIFGMAAALPCRSQDVILLREGGEPLTGRVLWDESRGDSLFFRRAIGAGDTLLLFTPRRRVDYVLRSDDSRMTYRGKRGGWQPWRGRTFHEMPRQRMLYGVSGGILTDGWSAEASAMRYLDRDNYFGVGGFIRYTETSPFRTDICLKYSAYGYSYVDRALSLGGQVELRCYMRRLKTYGYLQLGIGCSCHRFSDWQVSWRKDYDFGTNGYDYLEEYVKSVWEGFTDPKQVFTFHCKVGAYTRLTRGIYADLSVGCMGRMLDHTMSEIVTIYKASDFYPFGASLGLRFGRESGK